MQGSPRSALGEKTIVMVWNRKEELSPHLLPGAAPTILELYGTFGGCTWSWRLGVVCGLWTQPSGTRVASIGGVGIWGATAARGVGALRHPRA